MTAIDREDKKQAGKLRAGDTTKTTKGVDGVIGVFFFLFVMWLPEERENASL